MNDAHNGNEKSVPISLGLKAALVVSVLGFIVAIADKSHVTPAEVHATPAVSSIESSNFVASVADGPARATTPVASGTRSGADPSAGAPTARLYPEVSATAKDDEDGHPASF